MSIITSHKYENYQKLCPRIRVITKRVPLPEWQTLECLGYVIPELEPQDINPLFDTIRLNASTSEYSGTLEELPVLSPFVIKAMASPIGQLPTMMNHDSLIVRYLVKGRLELGF